VNSGAGERVKMEKLRWSHYLWYSSTSCAYKKSYLVFKNVSRSL